MTMLIECSHILQFFSVMFILAVHSQPSSNSHDTHTHTLKIVDDTQADSACGNCSEDKKCHCGPALCFNITNVSAPHRGRMYQYIMNVNQLRPKKLVNLL